ncbi:MAG: glycoside hydrolase family 65 protein [Bacteroidales bacterium]|nr:glycoside hydrolase family 65 protein [Bacteroidales bacterium]
MNNWILRYEGWNPEQQPLRESLCTLGNGVFATRGALEEVPENKYNYPGTYLAGGYNRAKSNIAGKEIENEDLVNWPNWLFLTFKHKDGDWFDLEKVEVIEYLQELNLKEGILLRKMKFRDSKERISSLISERLVSMKNPHEAGIRWTLLPENWSGTICIRSAIDGRIKNNGVARYSDLESRHIEVIDKGITDGHIIYLSAQSLQSEIKLTMASKTDIFKSETKLEGKRKPVEKEGFTGEDIELECKKLFPLTVEKTVSVYSSRDFAISDPLTEALSHIERLDGFNMMKSRSKQEWSAIWDKSDILIEDDEKSKHQMILRMHIFHLYQTVSRNSIGHDIGVPSRGWHGEAYRGHIFWDELYIYPFINLHNPQLARSLLLYRYRRLPEARKEAEAKGHRGSMFPWQSGSNGREESQVIHLNPESGRWIPDNTHLQIHINAAIAYNVCLYYQCTGDHEFLSEYGAEIILSTAVFWASVSSRNAKTDRYEINGIVGPDEYHTRYPGSEKAGLNNNAYTNFMAAWVLMRAIEITEILSENVLDELMMRAGFDKKDIDTWREISSNMYIPFNDDGIIMQFDGFEELDDLDWDKYRSEYGETIRLDRILEKEHDSPNRYKACKQADVLMIFYLFSSEEIIKIFERLGYEFTAGQIPENIEYYNKITSHGSTLSKVVHSWVYTRSDRNKSWSTYIKALRLDLEDEQGGTTSEGIHLGAMATTVDMVMRSYSGMEVRDGLLWFNPSLPEEISAITFKICYRSHWIKVHITHEKLTLSFIKGWTEPVDIDVAGKRTSFEHDDHREFKI